MSRKINMWAKRDVNLKSDIIFCHVDVFTRERSQIVESNVLLYRMHDLKEVFKSMRFRLLECG